MYTFDADGIPAAGFDAAGDTMYAGSGSDTIVAGTGNDTVSAQVPLDTIIYGSGDVTFVGKAPYVNVAASTSQTTVSAGEPVTLTGEFVDPDDADVQTYDWHVATLERRHVCGRHGASFTFTPTDPGTYCVTFTVSDTNGGTATRHDEADGGAVPTRCS